MFFMDLPDIDLQYQPIVVAQAGQIAVDSDASMRTMGVCFPVPKDELSLENVIDPKGQGADYLRDFEQKKVPFNPPSILTTLEQPIIKHGHPYIKY